MIDVLTGAGLGLLLSAVVLAWTWRAATHGGGE
jgi:hypothetical protein